MIYYRIARADGHVHCAFRCFANHTKLGCNHSAHDNPNCALSFRPHTVRPVPRFCCIVFVRCTSQFTFISRIRDLLYRFITTSISSNKALFVLLFSACQQRSRILCRCFHLLLAFIGSVSDIIHSVIFYLRERASLPNVSNPIIIIGLTQN
jgi:hypothetical protein